MKTKFLFSTLVMAAAFSACTQEEIVMNNEATGGFDKVAGAVLLGDGLTVVSDEAGQSRVAIEGGYVTFTEGDKAAVAWAVSGEVNSPQTAGGLNSLWTNIYANHMLVHNGKAFESRGNIYEGWHFAYRPFQYMNKPQALGIDFNGKPLTDTNLDIDKYENAPMISNALFLNKDNVDQENGRVKAEMDMSFIVNSLRPVLNIAEEFTGHEDLKTINITGVTVSAGDHELFTPSVTVNPKYLEDMTAVDENDSLVSPYIKEEYFGTSNKAFTGALDTAVTTAIKNAEAYNLGKKSVTTRIFLAPTQDATDVELSDLSFRIDVEGGHFDVKYIDPETLEEGEELTAVQETNNNAIRKLWYWLNGQMHSTFNKNSRDLKTLFQDYVNNVGNPNCTLEMELGIENFTADYLIENIDQWNGAVKLANALKADKPTFTLKDGAIVVFDEENPVIAPTTGVKVKSASEKTYDGSFIEINDELTWNDNVEFVGNGFNFKVNEGAVLTVEGELNPTRIHNYSTILAGDKSIIGNNSKYPRLINKSRVIVEYGAYVYPMSNEEGTIAYEAVKEDMTKPYRIKNLIETEDNAHGHANVNTLIINKSITIDFTKEIAGTPDSTEEDPYNDMTTPGVGAGTYDYGDLSGVTLEINGGTIKSSKVEETVKAIVMKGGKVSDVNVTDNLNLVEGTNTVSCSSIGSVAIENGKNTITANTINNKVVIEAGINTINNAEIGDNVSVEAGSVILNDVNIVGDLENDGTVTINGEGSEIANIINNGTLNANTDVFVKTIAVNSGSKANVAEENTIWYTIPQNKGGYIQKGTTTGQILFYGTTQFLADLEAAEEGATVTLNADVEISSAIIINEKEVTLDLNGHTISPSADFEYTSAADLGLISVTDGATVTIKNGSLDASEYIGGIAAVSVAKGTVIIEEGTSFKVNEDNDSRNDLIYVKDKNEGNKCIINGGEFQYVGTKGNGWLYTLNTNNEHRDQYVFTVNGGRFYQFIPGTTNPDGWAYEVQLGAGKKVYKNDEVTPTTDLVHEDGAWYTVK